MEAEPNDGDYFIFRTYATLYPTLFFTKQGYLEPIGKKVNGDLLLIGQSNKWYRYRVSKDFSVLGITFYPYTIPLFFGIQADAITNQNLDSNELNQHELLIELCQKVVDVNFDPDTLNIFLQNFATKAVIHDERILSLISSIASGQSDTLNVSGDRIFMSQRNFERKFKYYSGFRPKSFVNLVRLINSFRAISFNRKSLSDTTFEQDYFDQSHFSNEFKKHTGFQPKVFTKGIRTESQVWKNFVDFFQFLSICPPVLCKDKINPLV